MKNILYLHGFGGSNAGKTASMLKELVDPSKYKVFAINWDAERPIEELDRIRKFIQDNHIDLTIGSSLGGFMALNLHSLCRIVINPCYKPSVELPKLDNNLPVTEYVKLEEDFNKYLDGEDRELCVGFFGEHDELFSYYNLFKADGFFVSQKVPMGHHASKEVLLDTIIPYLDEYFENLKNIQKKF